MTRLIPPILIGAATGLADAGTRLIEQQPVGITTAITMATFVGGACIWLSRQFEKRDQLTAERDLQLTARLVAIEQSLKDLPCKSSGGCEAKPK